MLQNVLLSLTRPQSSSYSTRQKERSAPGGGAGDDGRRLGTNQLLSREISLICTVLYTKVLKINKLLIINVEYFNRPR